jgi:hypothetical protein
MTADLARAISLAEKYDIALDLVDGDRLRWRSRGPTPDAALAALKAAKPDIIRLLQRYRLAPDGTLIGNDALLEELTHQGFRVPRYGNNAALCDLQNLGQIPSRLALYAFADLQPTYALALRLLRAPDCLESADGRRRVGGQ